MLLLIACTAYIKSASLIKTLDSERSLALFLQIKNIRAIANRIMAYNIAPSGVELNEILQVAEVIFDKKFSDLNKVKSLIKKNARAVQHNRTSPSDVIEMILPTTITYNNIISRTVELSVEEPPGYIPLGFDLF